jgi:hypothetical protein
MHKEGRSLRATHLPSPPPPARPPASQGARGAAKPRITWRRGRCPVRSARWKPLRRGSRAPCCLDPGRGEQTGIPPPPRFSGSLLADAQGIWPVSSPPGTGKSALPPGILAPSRGLPDRGAVRSLGFLRQGSPRGSGSSRDGNCFLSGQHGTQRQENRG